MATLLTAAFSIDVGHTKVYLLFVTLGAALLASLAMSPWMRLGAASVRVVAPQRVTLGCEAQFIVECDREAAGDRSELRAEGPFLPYFGHWKGVTPPMTRAPGETTDRVTMRARFTERGELTLGSFRVSARVPLGLACGPAVRSAPLLLRVVPRAANVAAVSVSLLRHGSIRGAARSRGGAQSTDFVSVRPYRAGDRVRDLSPRAWARTGKPMVREYEKEQSSRVGIILDWAAPARPGRAQERAFEAAVSLAAGLVARLDRGDTVVAVLVCNGITHPLDRQGGPSALDQSLDRLAIAELNAAHDRTQTARDLAPFIARLSALVMVVDGWDEARESFAAGMENKGLFVHVVAVGEACTRPSGAAIRGLTAESIAAGTPVVA